MKGQQILLNSAHFGLNIGFASKKIALLMICFKTKSDAIVHWGIYPLTNVFSIWINYNDLTVTGTMGMA